MKFGSQNKSNMLTVNILIGIDDLDAKLQICESLKSEICSNFYEIWHLKQMEHANCECSTWN